MTTKLKFISDLIDEIALEKPLEWEAYNYEATKEVALVNAFEKYREIMADTSEENRELSIVSILAYLMLENTSLSIDVLKYKTQSFLI